MTLRSTCSCRRFCPWMIARCIYWFAATRLEASLTLQVMLRKCTGIAIYIMRKLWKRSVRFFCSISRLVFTIPVQSTFGSSEGCGTSGGRGGSLGFLVFLGFSPIFI